ncbi:MAG: LuxR family transcriptional regulator [Mycobacterium sp.]
MRLSWPMTGRAREMGAIEAAISAPAVSGILICGPEGIGKSRIAREAMAAATSHGCTTRWTAGTSSARAVPLGAFAAWAPSDVTDTVQLLRGVTESLTAGSSAAPKVVLSVDDVHQLDDLSTFVVQQIVQQESARLVLTVRDDEPIRTAIQEIWKAGQFDRLDLQKLSLAATTALLSAALRGPIDPVAAQRLWTLTQGNVLYLQNVVEQEVTDGRMVREHGTWRWTGEPVIPPGLVELIESRMAAIPTSVRDVVDVLAVGEPIELGAMTRIAGAAAVEEAEDRGLITLEPAGNGIEARVAHPLYGQVRRRRAPRSRLRRIRGLVATELAESSDREDMRVVVRCATLSLDSDLTPNATLLVKAAHGAIWFGDLPMANRLAESAIRAGAGTETNFVRAQALSWLGRGEEAEAVFAAIPICQLSGDDQGTLAFLRASNMLWVLADPPRARELIDAAAPTIPAQHRAYIDAFRTVYWFAMDEPQTALSMTESVVVQHVPVIGAELAWVFTQIYADAGRVTDAVSAADAGYTVATRTLDVPQMRFNIADAEVSALALSGHVGDALEVAARTHQQAERLPGAIQLLGAAVAGRAALAAGQLDSACSLLEQATEGLSASHSVGWGYRYRVPYVTALAMRGMTHEAVTMLAELEDVPRRFRTLDHEVSLARAWVMAGQGAVSEAISVVLAAAERARDSGRFAAEVICLQAAVQFGCQSCEVRLCELKSVVEGPRIRLAARFAAALSGCHGDELVLLSEEFARLGDAVAAVDCVAHAAVTYRRQGRRGSALGSATRALALSDQCGGAHTPALRLAGGSLPLTCRESEIAMLIGQGLSNRDVADRLTLSVRTIESHVYRAMQKTGTTSRSELGALLLRSDALAETAPGLEVRQHLCRDPSRDGFRPDVRRLDARAP